ncbi:MAG: NFACT family protein [Myxococcales bacterium]|nr:NFACT family protein [Myxococcales bacterium]
MLTVAEIAAALAELAPRIVGGQVQKIREPEAGTVVLHVRAPGHTTRLVLSARPGVARIAEAEAAGPTLPEPTGLGRWLRSTLRGRRLVSVTQVPGDRVLRFGFEAGELVAELTGRSANLIGLAPDGRVLVLATPSARGLRAGQPYTLPEPPPARPEAPPRFASALAIEQAAGAQAGDLDERTRAQRHAQVVRRARKRLAKLASNLQGDLDRAEGADEWARWGELLKPQIGRLRRGQTEAQVQDWYADGAPVVAVPLDPTLDGAENVARYFHKARRARLGAEQALERLVAVEAQLEALDALAAAEPDPEALETLLLGEGLLRPKAGGGGRRGEVVRKPFREWTTPRGDRVWVGRGGADNHALTFGIARGNDTWLHVRDVPGAHVIVPGATPHPETLLDAAALAAFHSTLREESAVDVSVTQRKHVRPIKGAPGKVTLAAARTLTVLAPAARVATLQRTP